MKYILDTCVLSELIKTNPNYNVINWLSNLDLENIYISVISIGELKKGIFKLPDSKKKSFLNHWLETDIISNYFDKILPISFEVCLNWGEIQANAELVGNSLPVIDSLIASTAIVNDCILVTRNIKDFEYSGCKTFNPWL